MKVLVSGASGLVGHSLVLHLRNNGHEVRRLVRTQEVPADAIFWDPEHGRLDPREIDGFDAVVHLAGENVASGRWTENRKHKILASRVDGTALLTARLLENERRPTVFIAASAIGAYGNSGDQVVSEESDYGVGFLAEVCREWEAASRPLADAGVRLVHLRIGVVLSTDGGALSKMLTPFKLCLGGVLGTGEQYFSWLTIDELSSIIEFVIERGDVAGPVNAVAPNPVTNRELTTGLGKALGRPTVIPMPAFAVRAMFGEMGEELLLSSTRVRPAKLEAAGYRFLHPELTQALEHLL